MGVYQFFCSDLENGEVSVNAEGRGKISDLGDVANDDLPKAELAISDVTCFTSFLYACVACGGKNAKTFLKAVCLKYWLPLVWNSHLYKLSAC